MDQFMDSLQATLDSIGSFVWGPFLLIPLLLGTGLDGATLFDLGGEWRAASALVWTPERAGFLRRLCQGMIRRHLEAGEGPFPSRDEA